MSALWQKVRPHALAWHMLPCVVMIGAMGGHNHGGHDHEDAPGPRGTGDQN